MGNTPAGRHLQDICTFGRVGLQTSRRGRRAGTTGTGAILRARRRRPAASTCAPLQKGGLCGGDAGTAGASGQGRRPLARSFQLYNLEYIMCEWST